MGKLTFADVLSVTGLALMGYGLFLYDPRVAYVAVGGLLLAAGVKAHKSRMPEPDDT